MQGVQQSVLLALVLALAAAAAEAQFSGSAPEVLPEDLIIPNTPAVLRRGASLDVMSAALDSFEPLRIHAPGASYVKLHFARFSLPAGVVVEVGNEDRSEVYRYASGKLDALTVDHQHGDDGVSRFFAMSVTGDTAVIRVHGRLDRFDPGRHGVVIDSWLQGPRHDAAAKLADKGSADDESHIQTTCGVNERLDAPCYSDSHPGEYDRSIPVALLITSTGEECTAWRVGPDNRMFTAEHCISGQDDLDGSEIWFHYRAESCGSSVATEPVKVTGGQLLALDQTLDYALFTVNDFAAIAQLGHLGLDVRSGVTGEAIFIPQHGLGRPRQIALESDMNSSGLCEIDDDDYNGYAEGSDIGYFCDTTTSSSGSPVISRATGKVIALHHLGGCFNSGSKISLIWPQVSAHFGEMVPEGDSEDGWAPGNQLPEAHFSLLCGGLSCSFDASASADGDGSVASYGWAFGDGGTATGMRTDHEFAAAGSYTVTLVVQDDEGATASSGNTVTVSLPNVYPVAQFSTRCQDNACEVNGGSSLDLDGNIVSWSWKFGDGGTANGAQATHQYSAAGSYPITLSVEDDNGAIDSRSHTVTVSRSNAGPQADFSVTCAALDCTADTSGSVDADGEIVAWHWDLGDGQAAAGQVISHLYAAAGTYTITLTVHDNDGATGTASRTFSALAPQPEPVNQAPEAAFTSECVHDRCTFDAGESGDSDGQIVAHHWSFGDGHGATGARVEHAYDEDGRFRVTLTVEDDAGAGDTISRAIEVVSERPIELEGAAGRLNGRAVAVLRWSDAATATVILLRDGRRIVEVANTGQYLDTDTKGIRKSARYQVCDSRGEHCSADIVVLFAPAWGSQYPAGKAPPGKARQ